MTKKTKIRKIGNSLGVIIPAELSDYLNVKNDSEVFMTADPLNQTVVISNKPVKDFPDATFYRALEKVDKEYGSVMKRLAAA